MNLTSRRRSGPFVAVVTLVALAAGSGSSSGAPIAASSTTTGGTAAALVVHIKDYAYDPPKLDVKPGEKVTFVNDDKVAHTATANDKSFDTGMIDPGKSKTVTVKAGTTGTDSYFCTVHNYMKGAIDIAR
jgi:plastocyanin